MPASMTTAIPKSLFEKRPLVIAALHLPDFNATRHRSPTWFEDYVLSNAEIFVKAGVPAIKLQDETREPASASPSTTAQTAALGRLLKREFPNLILGIIVQAHDAIAPIAIAHAAGADFVRIKVMTGQVMTAEGPRNGLGVAANTYRHALRREDIAILGDVYDRTSVPRDDVSPERAASWCVSLGTDGLVITGATFADTIDRIDALRRYGVMSPVIVGGGVDSTNIGRALAAADGVITSRSMMRKDVHDDDMIRWDLESAKRLMEAAVAASPSSGQL